MVHRIIEDIDLPFYLWQKLKPLKSVFPNTSLDTETTNGRCFLISDSNRNTVGINNLYTLLEYLNSNRYRKSCNWFYNLTYDTNGLLKYLPLEEQTIIANLNTVDYEGFRISIIPNKELKIGKINKDDKVTHPTFFYDLAQFYNMQPLKALASQTPYDKVEVEDINQIDVERYVKNVQGDGYHRLIDDRVEYDCLITNSLADKFTSKINKVVGLNKYRSAASIARRYVLENLEHNLRLPNKTIMQSALNAYHAGHIEVCKLGVFHNVYEYDLNSAYPAAMANLYDTTGTFKHNQEYEPDTAYSFYLIEIDYYDKNLTPVWTNYKNKNYHVNGKVDIWVTQPELEFFMTKGFDYKIKKAYHLMKSKNAEKPFHDMIIDLFNRRLEAKKNHDPIQGTYKLILTSAYGVTINTILKKEVCEEDSPLFVIDKNGEVIDYKQTYKATNMYNPLFATYITALTRVRLFTDFYKHLDDLISVNTDGVYLKTPVNVNVSKKLGDYSLDKINEIMMLGSGRYLFLDENGNVINDESRFRGFPKNPSEIYKLLKENKTEDHIPLTRTKVIKLKEATKNGEYNGRLNEFTTYTRNVYPRTETRHWFDQFDTIEDVFNKQLSSRPYNVNELKKVA